MMEYGWYWYGWGMSIDDYWWGMSRWGLLKTGLYRISLGYIPEEILHSSWACTSMPLPPHIFVKIRWKHGLLHTFHSLEFGFYPIPIRFHMLCVHPCHWVNKFKWMIHSAMLRDLRELLDPSICSPLVTPDNCTWSNMLLDYRKQGCCIPTWHNLHHT